MNLIAPAGHDDESLVKASAPPITTDHVAGVSKLVRHLAAASTTLIRQRTDERYPPLERDIQALHPRRRGSFPPRCARLWATNVGYRARSASSPPTQIPCGRIERFPDLSDLLEDRFVIPLRILHSKQLVPGLYRMGGVFVFEEAAMLSVSEIAGLNAITISGRHTHHD